MDNTTANYDPSDFRTWPTEPPTPRPDTGPGCDGCGKAPANAIDRLAGTGPTGDYVCSRCTRRRHRKATGRR